MNKNFDEKENQNANNNVEAPHIVAQRLLNIFRQLHIFSPEKKDAFNQMILSQPKNVKDAFSKLLGGSYLREYINNLEKSESSGIDYETNSSIYNEDLTFDTLAPNESSRESISGIALKEIIDNITKSQTDLISNLTQIQTKQLTDIISVSLQETYKTTTQSIIDAITSKNIKADNVEEHIKKISEDVGTNFKDSFEKNSRNIESQKDFKEKNKQDISSRDDKPNQQNVQKENNNIHKNEANVKKDNSTQKNEHNAQRDNNSNQKKNINDQKKDSFVSKKEESAKKDLNQKKNENVSKKDDFKTKDRADEKIPYNKYMEEINIENFNAPIKLREDEQKPKKEVSVPAKEDKLNSNNNTNSNPYNNKNQKQKDSNKDSKKDNWDWLDEDETKPIIKKDNIFSKDEKISQKDIEDELFGNTSNWQDDFLSLDEPIELEDSEDEDEYEYEIENEAEADSEDDWDWDWEYESDEDEDEVDETLIDEDEEQSEDDWEWEYEEIETDEDYNEIDMEPVTFEESPMDLRKNQPKISPLSSEGIIEKEGLFKFDQFETPKETNKESESNLNNKLDDFIDNKKTTNDLEEKNISESPIKNFSFDKKEETIKTENKEIILSSEDLLKKAAIDKEKESNLPSKIEQTTEAGIFIEDVDKKVKKEDFEEINLDDLEIKKEEDDNFEDKLRDFVNNNKNEEQDNKSTQTSSKTDINFNNIKSVNTMNLDNLEEINNKNSLPKSSKELLELHKKDKEKLDRELESIDILLDLPEDNIDDLY